MPADGGDTDSCVPSGKEEGLAATVSAEPAKLASSEASSLLSMKAKSALSLREVSVSCLADPIQVLVCPQALAPVTGYFPQLETEPVVKKVSPEDFLWSLPIYFNINLLINRK